MKSDYVHKDTLTATDYVELNKNNDLLMSYNQALLKENQQLKFQLEYEKENLMFSKDYAKCLEEKRDKYKSVLDEIREYIKELDDNTDDITCYDIDRNVRDDLLQILNKVKE